MRSAAEKVNNRSSSVAEIGGRSDFRNQSSGTQLRDSGGFSPHFPRYLQRLITAGTDKAVLLESGSQRHQLGSDD